MGRHELDKSNGVHNNAQLEGGRGVWGRRRRSRPSILGDIVGREKGWDGGKVDAAVAVWSVEMRVAVVVKVVFMWMMDCRLAKTSTRTLCSCFI